MTLIVSLRIPDGIVIAGDSLASGYLSRVISEDIEFTCTACKSTQTVSTKIRDDEAPSNWRSYSRKVFPFLGKYGVGTYGWGHLMGKTISFAMRELELEIQEQDQKVNGVMKAANLIGDRAHELMKSQLRKNRQSEFIKQAESNWRPLGFQVVGYEGNIHTTVEVYIGREVTINPVKSHGMTYSGQGTIADALQSIYMADANQAPMYESFGLQDAVDYAEFLISMTAAHQRFSPTTPNVGGAIDVAVITPFEGFEWIRQKEIRRTPRGDLWR